MRRAAWACLLAACADPRALSAVVEVAWTQAVAVPQAEVAVITVNYAERRVTGPAERALGARTEVQRITTRVHPAGVERVATLHAGVDAGTR